MRALAVAILVGDGRSAQPLRQSVNSPASNAKMNRYLGNEGNLRLMALPRAVPLTGFSVTGTSGACDKQKIQLELSDHKQATLLGVAKVVHDHPRLPRVLGVGCLRFAESSRWQRRLCR